MMNAIFCTTPFQVIVAFKIFKNNAKCTDIFILNQFEGHKELCQRIEEINCFRKIKIINEEMVYGLNHKKKTKLGMRLDLIKAYCSLDKIVNKIIPNIREYTDIYVSCNAFIPRIVRLDCQKNGYGTKFHFFDDGIGSYCISSTYRQSIRDKAARFFILGRKTIYEEYDLFLFMPELYEQLNPSSQYIVRKIEPVTKKDSIYLDKVYQGCDMEIQEKFIYFDTVRKEIGTDELNENNNEVIRRMIGILGEDNFIVKTHPRDKTRYINCKYIDSGTLPMEALYCHYDFTEKVLISVFSTAVFTPKIIFDQEPYVILLYKIFRPDLQFVAEADKFCRTIKLLYKDFSRIIIPESKEELYRSLDNM